MDLSRRVVLAGLAATVSGAAAAAFLAEPGAASASAAGREPAAATPRSEGWFAPGDDARHERTWMAWPARRDIWGSMLPGVRSDVALVARTIAAFEPVAMVVAAHGRKSHVIQDPQIGSQTHARLTLLPIHLGRSAM